MSCPPPCPPPPCPQYCPPPPDPPYALGKPPMRGLHRAWLNRVIAGSLILSAFAGTCVYTFIGLPRKFAYKDYYRRTDLLEMADEMYRKRLFQCADPEEDPDAS